MLEQKVKIVSESLARSMDRRKFLKGTGTAIFAGLASLAAGHSLAGPASARSGGTSDDIPKGPWPPQCNPPGPYCNNGTGQMTGCQGSHCHSHLYNGQLLPCRIMYGWYITGCWTTPSNGGYWVCCDCGCGPNGGSPLCGCAQWHHPDDPPLPSPDSPGMGAKG
jgi:hypothetical protein